MANPCSKCNRQREFMDYCATCRSLICPACWHRGCCGHTPVESGSDFEAGLSRLPPQTLSNTDGGQCAHEEHAPNEE